MTIYLTALRMVSLMFLFFYFYTTSLHWRGLRIKYRLLRIEAYETSIRVKWGDDALEEFQDSCRAITLHSTIDTSSNRWATFWAAFPALKKRYANLVLSHRSLSCRQGALW